MDLTSNLDLILESQADKEVTANALHIAASPAKLFAMRTSSTQSLIFGYIGGRMNGISFPNDDVTLTASTTNYIVAHRTTLVVSTSTVITNWNDTATYGRMYLVTTGANAPTDWEDHRYGTGGILGGGGVGVGGGTVTSVAMTVPAEFAIAGTPITGAGTLALTKATQAANLIYAGPTTGAAAAPTFRALVAADLAVIPWSLQVAVGDETTALTTGTTKITFRMPCAVTLIAVRASLTTVSSSGDVTVDINEAGATILSTKLTIDASEKTSTTAATPAVISDAALADDAEITIDIDAAGTAAAGLKVLLIGTRTP